MLFSLLGMDIMECVEETDALEMLQEHNTGSSHFGETLFIKCYKEGFDVFDDNYVLWLLLHNPEAVKKVAWESFSIINPLRIVVAYMHQGNKYFTVRKQIVITLLTFTL